MRMPRAGSQGVTELPSSTDPPVKIVPQLESSRNWNRAAPVPLLLCRLFVSLSVSFVHFPLHTFSILSFDKYERETKKRWRLSALRPSISFSFFLVPELSWWVVRETRRCKNVFLSRVRESGMPAYGFTVERRKPFFGQGWSVCGKSGRVSAFAAKLVLMPRPAEALYFFSFFFLFPMPFFCLQFLFF